MIQYQVRYYETASGTLPFMKWVKKLDAKIKARAVELGLDPEAFVKVMDGPTTLAHLRESSQTRGIPVIFMTARVQSRELEHFRALGAEGVISKPFDPLTLAASVRRHMQTPKDPLAGPRARFLKSARLDAIALTHDRLVLTDEAKAASALESIKTVAHRLAGGGGTVGYGEISTKALALEQAAIDRLNCTGTILNVKRTLDALVNTIEHV